MPKIYYRDRRTIVDTVALILAIVLTALVLKHFNVTERLYAFSQKHEDYQLDEIILTIACSSLYLSIYTLRRFFDLKKIVIQANTDPLIGTLNRRRGSELLRSEIRRIGLSVPASSLILFDLDDFKAVNDRHGHEAGDEVLKAVTSTVEGQIRRQDVLIRWGGEEFIILCPGATEGEASIVAERCRKSIESLSIQDAIRITASFGVVELHRDEHLEAQLDRVDRNLYESKRTGKNRITSDG